MASITRAQLDLPRPDGCQERGALGPPPCRPPENGDRPACDPRPSTPGAVAVAAPRGIRAACYRPEPRDPPAPQRHARPTRRDPAAPRRGGLTWLNDKGLKRPGPRAAYERPWVLGRRGSRASSWRKQTRIRPREDQMSTTFDGPARAIKLADHRDVQMVSQAHVTSFTSSREASSGRVCRCGHRYSAHQHYRRGSDCSQCGGCSRYRFALGSRFRTRYAAPK